MTVSGITSTSGPKQIDGWQSDFQQRRNSFEQIAQALQAGDLTQAQQAFSALTQNAPNSGEAPNGSIKDDFNTLGQALQSGDLDSARKAFATIQQDLQKLGQAHHHHHRHHTQDGQQNFSSSSSVTDNSSSSGAQNTQTNLSIIA